MDPEKSEVFTETEKPSISSHRDHTPRSALLILTRLQCVPGPATESDKEAPEDEASEDEVLGNDIRSCAIVEDTMPTEQFAERTIPLRTLAKEVALSYKPDEPPWYGLTSGKRSEADIIKEIVSKIPQRDERFDVFVVEFPDLSVKAGGSMLLNHLTTEISHDDGATYGPDEKGGEVKTQLGPAESASETGPTFKHWWALVRVSPEVFSSLHDGWRDNLVERPEGWGSQGAGMHEKGGQEESTEDMRERGQRQAQSTGFKFSNVSVKRPALLVLTDGTKGGVQGKRSAISTEKQGGSATPFGSKVRTFVTFVEDQAVPNSQAAIAAAEKAGRSLAVDLQHEDQLWRGGDNLKDDSASDEQALKEWIQLGLKKEDPFDVYMMEGNRMSSGTKRLYDIDKLEYGFSETRPVTAGQFHSLELQMATPIVSSDASVQSTSKPQEIE